MHTLARLLPLFASAALAAQTTNTGVQDVGLTLSMGPTGSTNAYAGQICGPFTCVPFRLTPGPIATPQRTVRVYGDANSLYVLLMSFAPTPTPCVTIPGIGNALILGQPLHTLAFGVTGPYVPSPSVACRQGVGTVTLQLPPVSTAAITYRLQALTFSYTTQGPAFTVAVQGR
ncbi:MAG: hypothetical protein FJ265_11260 [Planctomycetes bacterium]|nr:hypothetical protein [Planctomycetota bacterium]